MQHCAEEAVSLSRHMWKACLARMDKLPPAKMSMV